MKAIHCELFWDGQALWVADTHRAGGVFLDSQRIGDWRQIQGPAQLRFGQAAMDIETSSPVDDVMFSDPANAKPVTVTDMVMPPDDDGARLSNPSFGGAASSPNVMDLEDEKTRLKNPISEDDRTNIAIESPDARSASKSMDLRPRLGGGGAGGPAAATPDPHNAEATRMVSMPKAPSGSVPLPPGPPAAGRAPPPSAPPPPPPPKVPAPPASVQIAGTGPAAAQEASGQVGFAGPPPPAAPPRVPKNIIEKILWKFQKQPNQTQDDPNATQHIAAHKKQALPTRTWVLLAVTVLVTVGWLLWDDTPEPPPNSVAETSTQDPPDTPVEDPPDTPPETPPDTPPDTPIVANPTTPPVAPPSSPVNGASEEGADGETTLTLPRRAVDAYIGGRYAEALEAYRQLAASDPTEPSYGAMVRILEQRITEPEQ